LSAFNGPNGLLTFTFVNNNVYEPSPSRLTLTAIPTWPHSSLYVDNLPARQLGS